MSIKSIKSIVTVEDRDINEVIKEEGLLDRLNSNQLKGSYLELSRSLNTFLDQTFPTDFTPNSTYFFQKLDLAESAPPVIKYIKESLALSNYEMNMLKDETVILFKEPVIAGHISCTGVPKDKKSSHLRLISLDGEPKKTITESRNFDADDFQNKGISYYNVNEIVLGIILPSTCKIHRLSFGTISSIVKNSQKMNDLNKALFAVENVLSKDFNDIESRTERLNSLIELAGEKVKSLDSQRSNLAQERSIIEASIASDKDTLSKLRHEIDVSNNQLQNIRADIDVQKEDIKHNRAAIERTIKLRENEERETSSIHNQKQEASKALKSIRDELAEARKEKNLTTLDMAGHSQETAKQISLYSKFALGTFLVIVFLACYVYSNGQNFIESLPQLQGVSTFDILLSRLPLMTATALIVGGLTAIFFYLIKNIVLLNTEKMSMLKASILAADITDTEDYKDMDEQQRLNHKRDIKLKLINEVFHGKDESDIDLKSIVEVLKAANKK